MKRTVSGFETSCGHYERSRNPTWIQFGVVRSGIGVIFAVGRILFGHDDCGPMLGLKLLVGRRWREFHCLAARPWFIGRERGL